jgi:hypothetical protein
MWHGENHVFTTVSVSRHILMKKITSRPARVWRVTRSEPEATRATHRQETKTPQSEQDVRVVMRTASNHKLLWTSSPSFSSLGGGKSDLTIASRLRHPIPAPHLPHRLTSCGTSHRGAPRANRTARTASSDPPRTQSQPPRRGTETCTER